MQLPEDGERTPESKPKSPKKSDDKPNTREISYSLFLEGKTIAEIAEERGLKSSTIHSHLGAFVQSGMLDVTKLVEPDKAERVLSWFQNNEPETLTEVDRKSTRLNSSHYS